MKLTLIDRRADKVERKSLSTTKFCACVILGTNLICEENMRRNGAKYGEIGNKNN